MPHQLFQPSLLFLTPKYALDPTPCQLHELGITQAEMLSNHFVLM